MLITLFLAAWLQDFELDTRWEHLAAPWMTSEEAALYERLNDEERALFQAYFAARRTPDPEALPEFGIYPPCLFPPKNHGDVRDLIHCALGEPDKIEPNPTRPKQPRAWVYEQRTFYFVSHQDGVRLAKRSEDDWAEVKREMIVNPEIRYPARAAAFGRTRVPAEIAWVDLPAGNLFTEPLERGAALYASFPIPDDFRNFVREEKGYEQLSIECLVFLHGPGEGASPLEDPPQRHAVAPINFVDDDRFLFRLELPPGLHEAEILLYSGFLDKGLKGKATLHVAPKDHPRIGDPIVSQTFAKAGIREPRQGVIAAGGVFYHPVATYDAKQTAAVLVASPFDDTRLLLRDASGERPLEREKRVDGYHHFQLPPCDGPFELTALANVGQGTFALSSWRHGDPEAPPVAPHPAVLQEKDAEDYLALEQVTLKSEAGLTRLYVNGLPLVAGTGPLPWPAVDWGERARLSFRYAGEKGLVSANYELKRERVFREIEVQPKFITAGLRTRAGAIAEGKPRVFLHGEPLDVTIQSTESLPKLWGIVVNDPLIQGDNWNWIRETLRARLHQAVKPKDMVYLVRIGARPRLVLPPTRYKILLDGALNTLVPSDIPDTYFTLEYLIDKLSHFDEHARRPHHVLLLTTRLTDEIAQLEHLLPKLRSSGLQLYNLEFPDEIQRLVDDTTAKERSAEALEEMANNKREWDRLEGTLNAKDNEYMHPLRLKDIPWFRRKALENAKEAEAKAEALRQSYNSQVALLTAGLSEEARAASLKQTLHAFLDDVFQWQTALIHIDLGSPVEPHLVDVVPPDGHFAAWTLVDWSPENASRDTR